MITKRTALEVLDEALEELESAIPYMGSYFDTKWGYTETLERLKKERDDLYAQG